MKVLFPAKDCALVVTIPPLEASAGAKLNSPELIVAPFVVELELIAPTVTVASLPATPATPAIP